MELVSADRPSVLAIGEAMIELSGPDIFHPALRFAGDVMNTAIGLARLGVSTGLATALGDDAFSDTLVAMLAAEGVGTAAIARLPGMLPGLYAIRTDARGERSFHYWRSASAARRMLDDGGDARLAGHLARASHLHLSGISLAILTEPSRRRLMALLADARARGAIILFDGNYRPALWPDVAGARAAMQGMARLAGIALPTFDDEAALFGDRSPEAVARRLHDLGVAEVVVKEGLAGCLVSLAGQQHHVPVPEAMRPVDTSGAGDAFNAGYIAARLAGQAPTAAAMAGHRMAATALQHRGAIPPRAAVEPARVLA